MRPDVLRSLVIRLRYSRKASAYSRASSFDARKHPKGWRLHRRGATVDLRGSLRGNVEATGLVCGTTSTISTSNRGILHLKSSGSCEGVVHKNLISACALDASADVRSRPNITGSTGSNGGLTSDAHPNGCLTEQLGTNYFDPGSYKQKCMGIDASLSSSCYGKSTTVQPSSVRFLPCIKA